MNTNLDKTDERRHHHSDSTHDSSWQLVTQTLATACWHQDKGVVLQQSAVDGLQLVGSEGAKAKGLLEHSLDLWTEGKVFSGQFRTLAIILCLANEPSLTVDVITLVEEHRSIVHISSILSLRVIIFYKLCS